MRNTPFGLTLTLALALLPALAAAAQEVQPGMPPPPKPPETQPQEKLVFVVMATSLGDIVLELNREKAPISVDNFMAYTESKFYDSTIIHRVVRGNIHVIQGGGLGPGLVRKKTRPPIKNEWANGLKNARGTISMARMPAPDTATSQFFINTADNTMLDRPISGGAGYAVFGRVVAGMGVVDEIQAVPTGVKKGRSDVPIETVLVKEVRRITAEQAKERIEAENKGPTTKPAG
ncbi:MAG: peptidylprolyl isomerase [Planctomycetota bacterium]|jgi:peptidyl-prolyl cis-trans isomerase A (cyclophilin A)